MIQFKLDAKDLAKADGVIQKLGESLGDAMKRHLLTVGPRLEKNIKQTLNIGGRLPGKGPRGGKLRTHSSPGEPPRKQSGRLQNSVGYELEVEESKGSILVGLKAFALKIGAIRKVSGGEVQYAEDLELGTSKMLPRPWLVPNVMKEVAAWGKGLQQLVTEIRS